MALPQGRSSVLLVASQFPPRNNSGVYRTLRFARYLPSLGWNVRVLTLDDRSGDASTPLDEALLQRVPAAVEVHRASAVYPLRWLVKLRNRALNARGAPSAPRTARQADARAAAPSPWGRLKRLVTAALTLPDDQIGWTPFAVRQGAHLVRCHNIDVIYSSGPPWTNHLVGLQLRRWTGRPWVADFRDPWIGADFYPILRSGAWTGRIHRRLERSVVEAADRLVFNTPRSADDALRRYGRRVAAKLSVIPNGFDPADFEGFPLNRRSSSDARLVLAHAGSLYDKRNVRGLLEAIAALLAEGALPRASLQVQLVGAQRDGRSEEQELVARLGLADVVRLTPVVPHAECLRTLAEADVLLLVQVGARFSVPGKLFEYVALGKPILALAGRGATADLVRRHQLGHCVHPDDAEGIRAAIRTVHAERFSGSPCAVPATGRELFDGRNLAARLSELLRDLV